jgi:hypothetical protein
MITDQTIQKFEQMLASDFNAARDNLFLELDNGYSVFDAYTITRTLDGFIVGKQTGTPKIFSSLKIAASWCVADKRRQFTLLSDIERLDQQRIYMRTDISNSRKMMQSYRDPVLLDVVYAKMSDKQYRLRDVEDKLNKCANLAKYLQLRGFNNEIARTRRTAPNRTNR